MNGPNEWAVTSTGGNDDEPRTVENTQTGQEGTVGGGGSAFISDIKDDDGNVIGSIDSRD